MLQALRETAATDQVSDQVKALLKGMGPKPVSALECMKNWASPTGPDISPKRPPARAGCRTDRTHAAGQADSCLQKYRRREV